MPDQYYLNIIKILYLFNEKLYRYGSVISIIIPFRSKMHDFVSRIRQLSGVGGSFAVHQYKRDRGGFNSDFSLLISLTSPAKRIECGRRQSGPMILTIMGPLFQVLI